MAGTAATEINGLKMNKLRQVEEALQSKPEVLKAFSGPWRSRVRWMGGFKAKAYMRSHVVDFDEPSDLGTKDTAASAHEHILSAVGSCMMVGFVYQASKKGIKINDLEIAVEGNFENILKWAGLSDTGNPGYPEIKAKVYVKADADERELREIWDKAIEGSPVTQTVARTVKIIPEFSAA